MTLDMLILQLIFLSYCPVDFEVCEEQMYSLEYNTSLVSEDRQEQYYFAQHEVLKEFYNLTY